MDPASKRQWKVVPLHKVVEFFEALEEFDIQSSPPTGKKRIKNIYWDPDTKEIVIQVED